ncbi:MAG: hypothetical protein R6X33_08695 [Candidatus Brocadiia bacterium]
MKRRTLVVAAVAVLAVHVPLLAQTMYWDGNFSSVTLPDLTSTADVVTGNSTQRLVLTGDAELSADNTSSAQLSGPGGETLLTEYRLGFDGEGITATGAGGTTWTTHDSFLVPAVSITHVAGDDDVDVTLHVRASMPGPGAADAGAYSATQTLTVSWVGP